jgi:dephospho-CoA kinase
LRSTGILVVTGASGAGKTAAVKRLDARGRPGIQCYFFDSIGVPSSDEMTRDFGGPEGWQLDATRRWLERLTTETEDRVVSVLDGQTRPSFVLAILKGIAAPPTRAVLLDCTPAVRLHRLTRRGQTQLASERMEAWASYLRDEAQALDVPIIDTSALSIDDVADALEIEIQRAW